MSKKWDGGKRNIMKINSRSDLLKAMKDKHFQFKWNNGKYKYKWEDLVSDEFKQRLSVFWIVSKGNYPKGLRVNRVNVLNETADFELLYDREWVFNMVRGGSRTYFATETLDLSDYFSDPLLSSQAELQMLELTDPDLYATVMEHSKIGKVL